MNLKQLHYLREIVRNDLNISRTAKKLFTAQPGISKQIKLLEDELGAEVFVRRGKQLAALTPFGEQLLEHGNRALDHIGQIEALAADHANPHKGRLKIATTHTQARYALPDCIQRFCQRYPEVELDIYQGTPEQLAKLAGEMDLVIATEGLEAFEDLVLLPCYYWTRSILVPRDHPLTQVNQLTLEMVAEHPLITYVFSADKSGWIDSVFKGVSRQPRVALSAVDTDVIKTYVRLGLGVGIIATMAYQPEQDSDLALIDGSQLFPHSLTVIGIRPSSYVRTFIYDFIALFATHLDRTTVSMAFENTLRGDKDNWKDNWAAELDLVVR